MEILGVTICNIIACFHMGISVFLINSLWFVMMSDDDIMTHILWCIVVFRFYNKSPTLGNTNNNNNNVFLLNHNNKSVGFGSPVWHQRHKVPRMWICTVWRKLIHNSPFFTFTGLSQWETDQTCDASVAAINLCHLLLVPVCRPLASWHPCEAGRLTAT